MSDFAQSGSICTLQRLTSGEVHLAELDALLTAHAQTEAIALILPCHGDDLPSPALAHILRELASVPWLSEIVLSVNGAISSRPSLPRPVRLARTDHPAAREALSQLLESSTLLSGKGLNVWAALGLLASEKRTAFIATQDCDVTSFRRESLTRLCAPCLHPRLRFGFAKMYYSRVTDRLYGRVSRLFFAPLLQALLRVTGHLPLLDFLLAFRYPLAGECALRLDLATALSFAPGYGLETSLLCEAFRHIEPNAVCQVDGGTGYDHRHHPGVDASSTLPSMCGEIARALLAQLATEGISADAPFRAALALAFRKESAQALRRSEALALMNGLPFDASGEAAIVHAFTAALAAPTPLSAPSLMPWARLLRERPAASAAYLAQICTSADFT